MRGRIQLLLAFAYGLGTSLAGTALYPPHSSESFTLRGSAGLLTSPSGVAQTAVAMPVPVR